MIRTNAYSVLCVLTRSFAMWTFVAAVVALSGFLVSLSNGNQGKIGIYLMACGIPILVAALVWIFADKIAKLALARPQQMVFDSDISASEWQAVAFSVIGLWQAFAGLVGLTIHLGGMLIWAMRSGFPSMGDWPYTFLSNLIGSCVQLLLGLGLMFGARGLVGLIRRYRQMGHPDATSQESADASAAATERVQTPSD